MRLHNLQVWMVLWVACLVLTARATAQESSNPPVSFLNYGDPRLDVVGDPLPPRARMRLGTLRFLHSWGVQEMAVAPDEKTAITWNNNVVIACDMNNGKELWRIHWKSVPTADTGYCHRYFAFGRDSSRFYSTGNYNTSTSNNTIRIWNTRSNEPGGTIALQSRDLKFPGNIWKSIDVNPDGTQFVLGSSPGLAMFDDSGKLIWQLTNRPKKLLGVGVSEDRLTFGGDYAAGKFSPDEKMVACVRSQSPTQITMHDARNGAELSKIETKAKVVRFCFSAKGDSIIATERDCATRRYSIANQLCEWEHVIEPDPRAYESYTSAVDSSSDGKFIAVGAPIGGTNLIYLLEATTGKVYATLRGHDGKPWEVKFSKDSRSLLSSGWDATIRRWDVQSARLLALPEGIRGSNNVAYSSDGKQIAFADDDGIIHLLDALTGIERRTIVTDGLKCLTIVFSPDLKTVFCSGAIESEVTSDAPQTLLTGAVRAWRVESNELTHDWRLPNTRLQKISISPDGRFATAVSRPNRAYIWNIKHDKQVAELVHDDIFGVDVSRDSKFLATVGWDQMIRIWALDSGALKHEISVRDLTPESSRSGAARMYGVKFSPDGRHFAAAHIFGMVSIWNLNGEGEPTKEHFFKCDSRFDDGAIAYSPDGAWIACGHSNSKVKLYDAQTGDELFQVGSHPSEMQTLSFGADNRSLVSGGGGVSYVWNLAPEQESRVLEAQRQMATAWESLKTTQGEAAYRAIWAFADSPKAAEYIVNRLKPIRNIIDSRALVFGLNRADAERRMEAAVAAKANDSTTEFSVTVQRALTALGMSKSKESKSMLNELAEKHPNEVVRRFAVQAAKKQVKE